MTIPTVNISVSSLSTDASGNATITFTQAQAYQAFYPGSYLYIFGLTGNVKGFNGTFFVKTSSQNQYKSWIVTFTSSVMSYTYNEKDFTPSYTINNTPPSINQNMTCSMTISSQQIQDTGRLSFQVSSYSNMFNFSKIPYLPVPTLTVSPSAISNQYSFQDKGVLSFTLN